MTELLKLNEEHIPKLPRHAKLRFDEARKKWIINAPERVFELDEIASETGCKGKNLWQPIRFIITGQEHGPDLASFMSIIGIDECINRFNNVA